MLEVRNPLAVASKPGCDLGRVYPQRYVLYVHTELRSVNDWEPR